jgi:Protein of unknown function (DUF4089)
VDKQQQHDLERLIDASAAALGIAIAPEWKPGIVANLAAVLNAATLQAEFELPDEAEPAPTFEA